MMELRNKIKISLFLGDVQNFWENTKNKEKFFTIRKLNYKLLKSRYELGTPSEITEKTVINFEIKSPQIVQLKELYGKMKEGEPSFFSFVFNPTFDDYDELTEHAGAMVIEGCLCSVNESYVSHKQQADDRMLMSASLMIYSVRYTGGGSNSSTLSLELI